MVGGAVIDNKMINTVEELEGKMDEQVEHGGFLGLKPFCIIP